MPTVFIPAQLRELTGGITTVELEAASIADVVAQLEARFPGIADRLCTGGELSRSLQVAIDGTVTSRGLRAEVGPASEVHFLPAIGGG